MARWIFWKSKRFRPATGDSGEDTSLRRSVKTSLRPKASSSARPLRPNRESFGAQGLTSQKCIKGGPFSAFVPHLLELALSPLLSTTPTNSRRPPQRRACGPLLAGDWVPSRCLDSGLGRWHREVSRPFRLDDFSDTADAPSFSRAFRVADKSRANAGSPRGTFHRSLFSRQ